MSAFLCSEDHLNAIVNFAVRCRYVLEPGQWRPSQEQGAEQVLLNALVKANIDSLNARYAEKTADPGYTFKEDIYVLAVMPPVEILKILACFNYQCCEVDDYAVTWVGKFVANLQGFAIAALPGYGIMEWTYSSKAPQVLANIAAQEATRH